MSRDDLEQHIEGVLNGEKESPDLADPPDHPFCAHCGEPLAQDEAVAWEIEAGPVSDGGTNYYCSEEHKEQHIQDLIEPDYE